MSIIPDEGFEKRFRKRLEEENIGDRYDLRRVVPDTTLETRHMITACSNEISQLTQTASIKAFFVDIVILEKGAPDTIGVDIAKELRQRFPSTPVYNITSKYIHENELDILSEATLEDVDGVLVKSYLEGKRFSAKRLRNIFEKAEEKRSAYGMKTAPDIHKDQSEDARRLHTDVVILTALDEEQDVVLKHFPSDLQKVRNRRIRLGEHAGLKFALLAMHGKGNTRAAAITMWAITQLKPRFILLLGIAGGIEKKNERMLGDVLIPEVFVEYDHGKATPEGFEQRYQPYRASRTLLDLAHETEKLGWCNQIQSKRPDGTHKRINPLAHFGVLMSGQQVVTDSKLVSKLQTDWPETVGLEMESVGAALAVYENDDAAAFLMIKGISDWADPQKADNLWRDYAADAAAAFAAHLLTRVS